MSENAVRKAARKLVDSLGPGDSLTFYVPGKTPVTITNPNCGDKEATTMGETAKQEPFPSMTPPAAVRAGRVLLDLRAERKELKERFGAAEENFRLAMREHRLREIYVDGCRLVLEEQDEKIKIKDEKKRQKGEPDDAADAA